MSAFMPGTPEELMVVSPQADKRVYIDPLACALRRVEALLALLMGQFDESPQENRFSDKVITEVLGTARAQVETATQIVRHGWQAD